MLISLGGQKKIDFFLLKIKPLSFKYFFISINDILSFFIFILQLLRSPQVYNDTKDFVPLA